MVSPDHSRPFSIIRPEEPRTSPDFLRPAVPDLVQESIGLADYRWQNWSGSQRSVSGFHSPGSEAALSSLLSRAQAPIRAVGSGHSFSGLIPTEGTIISLDNLKGIVACDTERQIFTCMAGSKLSELTNDLASRGLALVNQGDVNYQSLAGAVSTGTHGTGLTLGCISTAVTGVRMISGEGGVIETDERNRSDIFNAARLSLGALGIITQLRIRCRESYLLREEVVSMQREEALERAPELASSNRHFEFFELPYSDRVIVKTLNETTENAGEHKAPAVSDDTGLFLLCELAAKLPFLKKYSQNLTMSLFQNSEKTDAAHRIFPSPRAVRFNEMEYEVPVEAGPACFREIVQTIRKHNFPVAFPLEFRTVAADNIWLSPFHGRTSASISVHQYYKQDYRPLFEAIEPIFLRYEGRPHWGKLHTLGAKELAPMYPRWNDFLKLRRSLDPFGRFLNPHLKHIFGIT